MYPVVVFTLRNTLSGFERSGMLNNTNFSIEHAFGFEREFDRSDPVEEEDFELLNLHLVEFALWGLIKRAIRYPESHMELAFRGEDMQLQGAFGSWRFDALLAFSEDHLIQQVMRRKSHKKGTIVKIAHNLVRGEVAIDMGPSVQPEGEP